MATTWEPTQEIFVLVSLLQANGIGLTGKTAEKILNEWRKCLSCPSTWMVADLVLYSF